MQGAFSLLSPPLQDLLRAEGFERPTAAQEAAIPGILAGEHTLLIAPTGMGKTESAVLPLFDRILALRKLSPASARKGRITALYVTPLRALNRDLMGRLHAWGKRLEIDVRVRHGDTSQSERARQSRHPPDVLITTPETIQVLFTGKNLRAALAGVRCVVVDEVHELAQDERGAQLAVGLERLVAIAGEFQRVGLSATVGDEREVAGFLAGAGREARIVKVPVAKKLDLRVACPSPSADEERLAQKVMCKPEAAAYLATCLREIEAHRQTLLFVNTRETAEVLAARVRILSDRGEPTPRIAVHHGSLSKDVRVLAEEEFKRGVARGLVCTSSMELGIDIGAADLVIQYGSPRQVTRLVQRVGRAGHRHDLVSNGLVVAQDADDVAESAVIARRTLEERLESFVSPRNPLDVLANQLAALAVERGRMSASQAYRLVRRAHNFRDLSAAEFEEVLAQACEHWLLWREGDEFGTKRQSREYLHANLSMIPDEKTFRIVNVVTNRAVATLDEGFVTSFIEPSATFICKGEAWRVVEISGSEPVLRVAPVRDPLGAIPSWIGEEIPVPFDVAQGVGALRAEVRDLARAKGDAEAAQELAARYRLDAGAAWKLVAFVEEQGAHALPTDRVVTLEFGAGHCVLNACFGTRVNEALGRILSSLLTARLGASVGLQVDPYRVVLSLPTRVQRETVKDVLLGITPDAVRSLLELVLVSSSYLRHRLLHVARKFGALAKDVDHQRIRVGRLLELFKGTPLYREAMREILEEKFDVPTTRRVLEELRSGALQLVVQDLSPIATAGLDQRIELIAPARADRTLLEALKRRLEEERVLLLCMNCRAWKAESRAGRAAKIRQCPRCRGALLAATRPWNETGVRAWKKKERLTDDERRELARLQTSANLVFDHGEKALLALVARGVGPDTAGRLLQRQRDDETAFLRDVLEAEVTYARTRQFWD